MADRLTVDAASLFIGADSEPSEPSVPVFASSVTASDPGMRFVQNSSHFKIISDIELRFPFADKTMPGFRISETLSPGGQQVAQSFFRLATHFKKEGYDDGLGAHAEPIARLAARNAIFAGLLEVGEREQIIKRDGSFYRFFPERLGLDYLAIREQQITDEAAVFFNAVSRALA